MMANLKPVDIIDVVEYNVTKEEREHLLDVFEYLMRYTTSIVKKAEFETNDFADAKKTVPNYTINLERISRTDKLTQWKICCIKDLDIKMHAMGQIGY